MKPQTCCCHVCKTSLNQYKREYLPCTQCNKIVCKNCFGSKLRNSDWNESSANRDSWICPSCSGTCSCPRCKSKKPTDRTSVSNGKLLAVQSEDMKSSRSSPSPPSSPIRELIEKPDSPKPKSQLHQLILVELEELINSEKRCDANIREMEKMLMLMKHEKEEILYERQKLELMCRDFEGADESKHDIMAEAH